MMFVVTGRWRGAGGTSRLWRLTYKKFLISLLWDWISPVFQTNSTTITSIEFVFILLVFARSWQGGADSLSLTPTLHLPIRTSGSYQASARVLDARGIPQIGKSRTFRGKWEVARRNSNARRCGVELPTRLWTQFT